jgi:hypothetical protein
MNCHLYLREGIVYLPTMGKVAEGVYRGLEFVAVVSASDIGEIRRALNETFARGNPPADFVTVGGGSAGDRGEVGQAFRAACW